MFLSKRLLPLLTAQFILLSFLTSCVKDIKPGVNKDKPSVSGLTYDDLKSGNRSISVFFFNEEAIEAGATSFNVQILAVEKGGDNYNVRQDDKNPYTAALINAKDDPNDQCDFGNLKTGEQYMIRARANYPGGVFSPWAYMEISDGEVAIVEVGYGLVNALDSAPKNFNAVAYDTKIKLSWSEKIGIDSYLLSYMSIEDEDYTDITIPKNVTAYTIENATPETEYTIVFRAEKGGNYSPEITKTVTTLKEVNEVYIRLKTENAFGGKFPGTTPSGIGVEFSVSNFSNIIQDESEEYRVGVYRDESCTDLIQSWDFQANGGNCSNGSTTKYKLWGADLDPAAKTTNLEWPGMFFSGLKSDTPYFVKVELPGHEGVSATVAGRTQKSHEKLPSPEILAAVGDTVLFGEFNEFVWGGETSRKLPGISTTARGTKTAFDTPKGTNGFGPSSTFFICLPSQDIGFLTQAKAIDNTTYLKHWRVENSYCLNRSGFVRTGNGSGASGIITPALSSLKTVATVELSFDLLPDGTTPDALAHAYRVELLNNAVFTNVSGSTTYNNDYILKTADRTTVKSGEFSTDYNWQRISVTVADVTPESRFLIGGAAGVAKGLDIDNICVKVVSYVDATVQGPVTNLAAAGITGESAIITWSKPYGATSYKVRYKEASATEWIDFGNVSENSANLTGLTPNTEYVVSVMAIGNGESEWAETTFTTLDTSNASILKFSFAEENISITSLTLSTLNNSPLLGTQTSLSATPDSPLNLSSGTAEQKFTIDVETIDGGLMLEATLADNTTLTRLIAPGKSISTPLGKTTVVNLGKWLPGGIANGDELVEFAWLVNRKLSFDRFKDADGVVVLLGDIDMTGISWIPIGNTEAIPFTGKFDGKGHTIDNINNVYNGSAMYMAGLFGVINNGAVIKNTTLGEHCVFDYTRTSGWVRQGAFVSFGQGSGANACTLENLVNKAQVIVHGKAKDQQMYVGGIAGQQRGPVRNCRNEGKVTLINSFAVGTVYAAGGVIGGIDAGMPSVSGLENNGEIDIQSTAKVTVGGVIGTAQSTTADGLINRGTVKVSANAKIGGIIGAITITNAKDPGSLKNSAQYGAILFSEGQGADAGLLIGTNNTGSAFYSYSNLKLSGSWGVNGGDVHTINSEEDFTAQVQSDWSKAWSKDAPDKMRLVNCTSTTEAFYTEIINATLFGKE